MLARILFCMWWKIYNEFLGSMKGACKHRPWKQCVFFSRVVLPNSDYWSQGFEIKTGFHSSMYLEISQRCGYFLDNFWTWTEINGSNLKVATFMNKKLSPSMVGRLLSSVISSFQALHEFYFHIHLLSLHSPLDRHGFASLGCRMDGSGASISWRTCQYQITSFRFSLLAIFHFILWTDFFETSELCTGPIPKKSCWAFGRSWTLGHWADQDVFRSLSNL